MAAKRAGWSISESGILRKKEEDEELLVFGYSCKLFRDDEKALFIDQGKHLIPWMGDESLKIDRYDGRGALMDLKLYEPPPGGYDAALGLSEAERRVEQLCDEERYRSLQHNEEEEALYQEEELKRLHQALDGHASYGQVAFNYDNEGDATAQQDESTTKQETAAEEDEVFIVPPGLDIPVGMVVPETVKQNAIIEKTAHFISRQGAQMEILLKMKQANNQQFSFLSFDDQLHAYYRHLLMAIKTGRYRPKQPKTEEAETDGTSGEEHYLHPSLASTAGPSRLELAPSIPSIAYKPSADCAYSLLVNKIRTKQVELGIAPAVPAVEPSQESAVVTGFHPGTNSQQAQMQQQYQQHYSAVHHHAAIPQEPSQEMVLIIDKMALYVAKNGRAFEDIVRSKCDKRFAFLDDTHHLHALYKTKVAHHLSLLQPPKKKRKKAVQESRDPAEPVVSTVELQPMPKPETEAQDTEMAAHQEANGLEDQPPPPGEGEVLIGPRQEHSPEPELQDEANPEPMIENGEEHSADEKQQCAVSPVINEESECQKVENDREMQAEQEEEKQQLLLQEQGQQQQQREDGEEGEKEKEEVGKEVEEERNNDSEMDNENMGSQKHSEKSSREVSPTTDSEKEGQPRVSKPAPVCFSIKKPREMEGLLEMRSALPIEESSDEEESEESKKTEANKKQESVKKPEPVKRVEPTKRAESSRRQDQSRRPTEVSDRKRTHDFTDRERERDRERDRERERERERERDRERERERDREREREREREKERKRAAASERRRMDADRKRLTPDARRGEVEHKKPVPDRKKPHIEVERRQYVQHTEDKKKEREKEKEKEEETRKEPEVVDLTGDVTEDKKPAVDKDKWAEERLKDRLAAAAREKIAAAAREKQLQLERKRRAAAFLNMIRKDHPLPTTPVIGPTLPDGGPVQRVSADEDEISSLPSPASSDLLSPPTTPVPSRDVDSCGTSTGNSTPAQVQQSSLLARLQAQEELKRQAPSHSPSIELARPVNEGQAHVCHRHKRKKESHHSSRHKKGSPPHKHRHKQEEHDKSRKLKKKERERPQMEPGSRHREKRKKHHKSMRRLSSASSGSS